ncbi:tubulin-specific chaperone B [Marchantia polymorpha subsp. ruderalis]|uniref:CAP-Gly domain-containing protein n=2 Tax=Marchantia polymorpha TaxID=3197 RepID=A0AAF6BQZ9_MARPO|nr:hypothetical protein MARPO_0016s0206 [Marchantia polymorpha]PTQ45167.1 hypothetical protein MARPO_0016s0206 [Marchantia polymorpha]BBN14432.1 hypothetical protein Mp_6g11670 [Marchantia polymorpha subsp. ruderalis]BBN14433.1 hypothetical protein Mp_6g11670 [Marchantia polymorpha subsp. ruderalis]|eukprot:PTQ45166.1 hypothetical protein MARPO_0016s0206 [Marchantia polymorpha]
MSVSLNALKNYVRTPSSQNQAEDTVLLHVSHSNLRSKFAELRFDLHTTIGNVKEKLRSHTGSAVESMHLQLYDDGGAKLCDLAEDHRPLGFYSPLDGYRIHIVDLDPTSLSAGGWLEDTSLVEKYTISEDSYNKRDDTFRKFKEKRLAEDPTWTLQKEMARRRGLPVPQESQPIDDDHMKDVADGIKIGDRCEVDPGGKRGEVKYVGRAETLAPGFWVGVQYDEPVGKHDGLVKGKRYFSCPPQYGSMLRPDKVKVGDYPERDPFEDDDEEI